MKSNTAIVSACFVFAAFACGGSHVPVSPSTTTASPSTGAPASNPHTLSVGQSVQGTWTEHGALDDYDLTAPSDGTIVVRLTWSADYGGVDLKLADQWIIRDQPVVARLAVKSGQRYRLTIADRFAWDYDRIFVEYVLMTAME